MKNIRSRTKELTYISLSASLAILLSYVEFLLPPLFVSVPGIKIGLPNVVILYVLYCTGIKHAVFVSFVRICISTILFGNTITFAYSITGAILSLLIMTLLKKADKFSVVGVSVAGAVIHNLGQILVASLIFNTPQIAYYIIVLTITGTIAGTFIGLCGATLIKRISSNSIFKIQ